jgi:hypothetical protein
MKLRRKIILWFGLIISIPATGFGGISVVFYFWLNAAQPERWSEEKSAIWAYGALTLTVMFFIIFIYCMVSLIKESRINSNESSNAI